MNSRKLEYTKGNIRFIGDFYWDETQTGQRPGVVVFPEAFGLSDHARERAQRLAGMGYAALAADPHGDARVFAGMEDVGPAIQALFEDRAEWRSRAQAALDALVDQPEVDGGKTAAIGFCFGGATCLELARNGAPLKAFTSFHGGLLPELPEDAGKIQAKVLICHGAEDPLVKDETLQAVMSELRRDKVDWQLTYYGNAVHSFTNPGADSHGVPGLAYHAATDARSWAAMCHLFDEVFTEG